MNVGKAAADNHSDAVTSNSPCGVLATASASPVLASNDNFANSFGGSFAEGILVHDEICHRRSVGCVAKIVHEGVAEELRVACCARKIAGGYDEIGVAIVNLYGKTSALYDVKFLFSHVCLCMISCSPAS